MGRGGASTAASPPLALQRPSAGGPVSHVPSLHCIVAPGGGDALAAGVARSAAEAEATGVTAAGGTGALRVGNVTTRPPWLAHADDVPGATMNAPSRHCATASAGGSEDLVAAGGRVESSGTPTRAGAGAGAAGAAWLAVPRAGAAAEGGGGGGTRRTSGTGCESGGEAGGGGGELVAGACASARTAPSDRAIRTAGTSLVMATP